jgi:hypothetical protein
MSVFTILRMLFFLLIPLSLFQACETGKGKEKVTIIRYERFRDSVLAENRLIAPDTSNIFDDDTSFTPGVDSVNTLLITIDTLLRREISVMERMDSLIIRLKNIESYSQEEKANLKENISMLDSFLTANKPKEKTTCREKECYLYVEVIKSRQTLYLYLDGMLKDSFPVSTGIKKYTTPNINLRPTGPLFTKYTSRKWLSGNYKDHDNMPYAVFIKGGYAIHGTNTGNLSKSGMVASHGCISLHPDNAKVFYELVNLEGLSDTWVHMRDYL